ncbi:MAG: carboxylesterase family protein [Synergistaceae bacterium]|nr:carboxylesterase family protein [Synergistaceae bacterium]
MKKLFTIDDLMIAFVTALGYGLSFEIPKNLGLPAWLCVVICLVIGVSLEGIVAKILFSKLVQKNTLNKVITFITFILIFLAGQYISVWLMGISMLENLLGEYVYRIGIPVIGFMISMLIRWYRIRKIRKLYGDGSKGYVFNVTKEDIEEVNQQNKPISGEYDTDCAVKTRTGIYVGEKYKSTIFYLGIPYAKPPVGELRWKAPEPLPSSNAVFEAKNFGASAIQLEQKGSIVKHHRQSEDCLSLNICVASKKSELKKPVLVLFHHGSFTHGGSVDPLLYGDNFVEKHNDIVFVSFNYRLGIFGFIDFSEVPGGEDYPDTLNLGLLDQIMALKWIKENIAAFGGDPNRITVIGFEAGAISICMLAASAQAKNLFKKAFAFNCNITAAYNTTDGPRALARDLLKETQTKTMAELLQLKTETLKNAAQKLWRNLCGPTCDGILIPTDVYSAYHDGAASGIEFIIGIPSNETQVFHSILGDQKYRDLVSVAIDDMKNYIDDSVLNAIQEYIETQKASSTELEAKSKILEQLIALSIYRCAAKLSEGGSKVYLMYWNEKPLIENLGSGTVDVVATLLGNSTASQIYGNVMNTNLSDTLQSLLEKFINGNALQLYNNEIKGINAITWNTFPQALIISDEKIQCDTIEDKLTTIKSFLEFALQ